jgi:hypothetical protein
MLIIPVFGRLRQEDHEFGDILKYIVRRTKQLIGLWA